MEDEFDDDPKDEGRGRSARKREVKAIADLAKRLVDSRDPGIANIALSEELRSALVTTRETKSHGARKRQLKFFTGLMRQDEEGAATARRFLDGVDRLNFEETRDLKKFESLRDDLLDLELFAAAMKRACDELPSLDRREISSLARAAHKKPSKKLSRAVFRCLRDASAE